MTQANEEELKSAQESLDDILRRIGPFRPKPPKAKPAEKKEWRVVTEGTFPPYPITRRSVSSAGGL